MLVISFRNKFNIVFYAVLLLWLFLAVFFPRFQSRVFNLDVIIIDIILVMLSWYLYKKESFAKVALYLYLFASIVCMFMGNLIYWVVYRLVGIRHATTVESLLFMMPYLFFLILQYIFWCKFVKQNGLLGAYNYKLLIPYFVVNCMVVLIFVIASYKEVPSFTYTIGLQMIIGLFDLILLNIITLVLICAKSKGVYLMALSSSMIITTNFWWMYLFHNQALGVADYSTIFWLLAQILMVFGMLYLKKMLSKESKALVYFLSEMKCQVTLWSFSLSIFSVIILCFLGYSFNLITVGSIESLPFLIMIFSLLIISMSKYMGDVFDRPFKIIHNRIEVLMGNKPATEVLSADYNIREFYFLDGLIEGTFSSYEEGIKEKKVMVDMALQMAHDIRSPVSALLMLAKGSILPEHQKQTMRNVASRVEDISNQLLNKYKKKEPFPEESNTMLVSASIMNVVSEKRLEHEDKNIIFSCDVEKNSFFSYINISQIEFKRMLSNLINNSVDSIKDKGTIIVGMIAEQDQLVVRIIDSGKGMPKEQVSILSNCRKMPLAKEGGFGLGLSHAASLILRHNAKIEVSSSVGTEIRISFIKIEQPLWITDTIVLNKKDIIIILDDDSSMHGAWESFFSGHMNSDNALSLKSFTDAYNCLAYIHSCKDTNNIFFIVDHELEDQEMNGLDVLACSGVKRSVLVTSFYEKHSIIKSSILLNVKIIPKKIACNVNVFIEEDEEVSDEKPDRFVDLILLENSREFSDVLAYLYSMNGKEIKVFNSPYNLLDKIGAYSKEVKICLDYDLGCPVNGLELAEKLFLNDYKNLYLASGYKFDKSVIPSYVKCLDEKKDLLDL